MNMIGSLLENLVAQDDDDDDDEDEEGTSLEYTLLKHVVSF